MRLPIEHRRDARRQTPDLASFFDFVAPKIADAVREAHRALDRVGIRHVVTGDVAVGAYAEPRVVTVVEMLVGDEAFERSGNMVMFAAGVPIAVGSVPVRLVPVPAGCPAVARALEQPRLSEGIPVIAPEYLVLMKLVRFRARDRADLFTLLLEAGGVDAGAIRRFVHEVDPELGARLDSAVPENPGGSID